MSLGSSYGTDGGDNVEYFYGAKIKEVWYFFEGATVYLPRNYYQDDIHKPFNLALMKQIAIEEIFNGYLVEIPSDNTSNKIKYRINDHRFISMENRNGDEGTFGNCLSCKTFNEYVIYLVNNNWKDKMDSIQ